MAVHLTPDLLRASYDRLRLTAPFNKWKLPPGDEVAFDVTTHEDRYGHFTECRRWKFVRIGISAPNVKNLAVLDMYLAHEMVHLYLHRVRCREKDDHGKRFQAAARKVCRIHRFDPDLF